MKKAFLFVLAALCVSAAQAVTYTWSNCDNTAGSSNKANYTTLSISFFVDSTVQNTLPTTGEILLKEIAIIRREDPLSTNPSTVKLFDGATEVATATVNVTTDDVLDMNGPGLYTRGAYHLVFGDDVIVDVTKTYTLKGYDANGTAMNGDAVFGITVVREETGTQWVAPMRVTAESVPVPEPTALVLLALGVAGLALKRKVA